METRYTRGGDNLAPKGLTGSFAWPRLTWTSVLPIVLVISLVVVACAPAAAPTPAKAPATAAAPAPTAAKAATPVATKAPAAPAATPAAAAPAKAPAKPMGTIRTAILPYMNSWPLHVGLKKGFFEQAGVNISIQNLEAGATMVSAMTGGSLDLGTSVNSVSALQAVEQGLDLQFVASLNHENKNRPKHAYVVVMVAADSPIKTAKDLEGKKVADNSIKGLNQLLFDRWMKKNGADPTKKQHVNMPTGAMEGALKSKQIDALITAEPMLSNYLRNGSAKILAFYAVEVLPEMVFALQVVTRSWAEKNPDLLKAYLKAYNKSVDWLNANETGEAMNILAEFTKTDLNIVKQMYLPESRKGVDAVSLQQIADLMAEDGYVSKKIDVKKYVSPLATTESQ